jgi:hypothetical protein
MVYLHGRGCIFVLYYISVIRTDILGIYHQIKQSRFVTVRS